MIKRIRLSVINCTPKENNEDGFCRLVYPPPLKIYFHATLLTQLFAGRTAYQVCGFQERSVRMPADCTDVEDQSVNGCNYLVSWSYKQKDYIEFQVQVSLSLLFVIRKMLL